MEVMAATTNNHNQKELRLYAPNGHQQTANSTTSLATGARSPFQREVREWQRIDPDTGALLTGRLEADRWINGPLNKYGKISDSQNIAQPNGIQQTQRKQLEVLQTCTAAGGAMQVIRSQTVQTTSSRWSTSSASPLLLSASTSPIPTQQLQQTNNKTKHSFQQKAHKSPTVHEKTKNTTTTKNTFTNSSCPPFVATTTILTNGFNHRPHHLDHLQQYPHSLVNGISIRNHNRDWPDLTENMSTLHICDNDHDNEHDHDSNYIVQQQSSDEQPSDDNDNDHDDISLIENNNDDENRQYLLDKRNNLKNVNSTKRNSFTTTVFANNNSDHYDQPHRHNDHDSHDHHQQHNNHNHNLSRDSSSGSCSNNNQLFLLDTAPSLKLSNLMKSSSSLSNSSNNSTTASQTTTTTTTAITNPTSMSTHKNMATNKISLHAIVGSSSSNNNNSNNNNKSKANTATTTSSTPSPTYPATTTRSSWHQPSLYRQNSYNNSNNTNLMNSRVGDNSNCCSSSSSDESRSYAGKTETDLRHLQRQSPNQNYQQQEQQQQQQQQQQIHFKQKDRLTPTHSPHTYHRVDLESFRQYNNDNSTNNNNDTDDDGLRLSSRHLRRQQTPSNTSINSLERSRSISTDDLSTEWNVQGIDGEEPAEWRRVSKLRRSFQSATKTNQTFNSPTPARRPLDLPANSVSVSKIRAELENGRRLNTVMRNNHVDLAALSSILNGCEEKETKSLQTSKSNSFLTAESLKEIRAKLKKLSDESLYKEDFLISQQNNDTNSEVEHIVVDQTKIKGNYGQHPERYKVTNTTEELSNKHTTNSLESRLKYRDINSSDWHIRRKSYGFEKMSPPEKSTLRMDASTDSGLGRSGELQNWSPTSEAAASNRTVVHLGETAEVTAGPIVQRRYRPQKLYEESEHFPEEDPVVSKRHSIAVDESQYVHDNARQTTQIHLNGFYEPGNYSKLIHSSESTTTNDRGQQKRVEFSKTEVHFATESGRVNIVETDSKPPPTNNFRRRRSRTSSVGPLQSLVKPSTTVSTANSVNSPFTIPPGVAMPVTLFGDDNARKKTIATTTVAYRAPLVGSTEPKDSGINVTVTIPSNKETLAYADNLRNSYASTSGVDTTDCDTDEMTSLRGILKNKPAKPKPYVLGENIEKPDDLWGVQLKPIGNQTNHERVFKSESPPLAQTQKSVAERIQELGSSAISQTNSFSSKINVNLGNTTAIGNDWEETGQTTNTKRRPTVHELLIHDLKKHQKILDEGLKSTTLIIRTMRSATEFDEAMRRLSMASIEAAVVKPTPMLRSNSYQESKQSFDYLEPDFEEIKNLYKSSRLSSTSSSSTVTSSRRNSQDSRKTSTDSGASFTRNDTFMPRLSFLDNEQMPVNQQLQRLRMIYDHATISQDEDSADEEVKSYFREQIETDSGGGTQDSSPYEDDHFMEPSNSWSRLKSKKSVWQIDVETNLKKTFDKTELPKSNVMSIKLHSPQAETEAQPAPPIAKPRSFTAIQEKQTSKTHATNSVKQPPLDTILPTKDSLKIIKEARGARQLRDHELSYFGVPISTLEDEKPKSKYTSSSNFRSSPKRSLPLRKLSDEKAYPLEPAQGEQWQLENDKPDLLKHNAIEVKPAKRTGLKNKADLDENEEHLYENIANDITPVFKVKTDTAPEQYDRKMDLKRDAMILSEMNKNADQTLRELSDEAALKDRRRRSLQRRNSKPLETIDEKSIAERINDTCIAVKISRGPYSSETRKSSRNSTPSPTNITDNARERTSSQSSVECCPRARSRSLSSEKEYELAKSKPSRISQMVKHKPQKLVQSRSSSLDSQRSANSQYSSGEDQQRKHSTGSFRREDRSRAKTKRITSSIFANSRDKHGEANTTRNPPQQQQHNHCSQRGDSKRLSSTTHSSSHRERVECRHDNATGAAIGQQHQHHNSSSSGLQRSTATTSSGRRHKDEYRDSQRIKRSTTTASGRSINERQDKHEKTTSKHGIRSVRDEEKNSSQRSSSHRLESGDKDKEKSSRSTKGHCSRSLSHHHRERSTNTEKHTNAKDCKTKSANPENTTSSKNVPYHHHQSNHALKERHERQHHKTKRDEDHVDHVHGLKSAIIKTTTKLRDKSRNRKEKK